MNSCNSFNSEIDINNIFGFIGKSSHMIRGNTILYECDQCDKEFHQSSHLREHLLTHTGIKPYKCELCQYSTVRQRDLKKHELRHTSLGPSFNNTLTERGQLNHATHGNRTLYKCDQCYKEFKERRHLREHLLTHTGIKPYKCELCQHSTVRQRDLKKHELRHTSLGPSFNNTLTERGQLNHATHGNRTLHKCDQCYKEFKESRHLREHLLTHTGIKPYKCELCQHSTVRQRDLKKHELCHTSLGPSFNNTLTERGQLNHATHGNRTLYKCNQCYKEFKERGHLREHLLTHTGIKPYKCELCQHSTVRQRDLKKHELRHTSLGPSLNNTLTERGQLNHATHGNTLHKCDQCYKEFYQSSHLLEHLLTHNSIKPYKSELCQYSTVRQRDLKKRELSHTLTDRGQLNKATHGNTALHKCDLCHKEFKQIYHLQDHMAVHSTAKPHECESCEQRFKRKRELVRHKKECTAGRCTSEVHANKLLVPAQLNVSPSRPTKLEKLYLAENCTRSVINLEKYKVFPKVVCSMDDVALAEMDSILKLIDLPMLYTWKDLKPEPI